MARKRKWQCLKSERIEDMTRKQLFELARINGLEPERRTKTSVIRAALIEYLTEEEIEEEVEEIVNNYKTLEEIKKSTATKNPIKRLPRKLDI